MVCKLTRLSRELSVISEESTISNEDPFSVLRSVCVLLNRLPDNVVNNHLKKITDQNETDLDETTPFTMTPEFKSTPLKVSTLTRAQNINTNVNTRRPYHDSRERRQETEADESYTRSMAKKSPIQPQMRSVRLSRKAKPNKPLKELSLKMAAPVESGWSPRELCKGRRCTTTVPNTKKRLFSKLPNLAFQKKDKRRILEVETTTKPKSETRITKVEKEEKIQTKQQMRTKGGRIIAAPSRYRQTA